MKKNFTRALALALSLITLALCFASCGSDTPADSGKPKVTVKLYTLEKGEDSLFLGGSDIEMETGKTAFDAVDQLCTARSATYTVTKADMFDTFTYDGKTYSVPEQETVDAEKNIVRMYHYSWKLNGTLQDGSTLKTYTVADNDLIEIVVTYDEVTAQN